MNTLLEIPNAEVKSAATILRLIIEHEKKFGGNCFTFQVGQKATELLTHLQEESQ